LPSHETCFSCISERLRNTSKSLDQVINLYSSLQITERLYNNYYKYIYWPPLMLLGIIAICIPSSIGLAKWKILSDDPRVLLLPMCIIDGWFVVFVSTNYGSKVNAYSNILLKDIKLIGSSRQHTRFTRKRIKSKTAVGVKISDNLIDKEMPLNIFMFCVDNIISLLAILND